MINWFSLILVSEKFFLGTQQPSWLALRLNLPELIIVILEFGWSLSATVLNTIHILTNFSFASTETVEFLKGDITVNLTTARTRTIFSDMNRTDGRFKIG